MCAARGRITAAVLVDHIKPIRDGGAILDDDNLQSLCRACHDAKTVEDVRKRTGGG
jgi:5-methylcytosine-specific restriction protein A